MGTPVTPHSWPDFVSDLTRLVRHGRVREADSRWSEAMRVLDADGAPTEGQREVGLHVHRREAEAWLDVGDVKRARAVVDRLSPELRARSELAALVQRLHDVEEAEAMGASLRPRGMPAERWWQPMMLPEVDAQDRRRTGWYPGRVDEVTGDTVVLVLGVPDEDPALRRAVRKTLSHDEWRRYGHGGPHRLEGRFVEVGVYGGDHVRITLLPSPSEVR